MFNVITIEGCLLDSGIQQFSDVYLQQLSHLCKRMQVGLRAVGAPFGDCGRIFAQFSSQPFARPFLLDKHNFEAIDIFHIVSVLLMLDAKLMKLFIRPTTCVALFAVFGGRRRE
jgi:hypothetical protein